MQPTQAPIRSPAPNPPPLLRSELFATVSLATDLGAGRPREHGLRTCLLALRLAQALDLDAEALQQIYDLALLDFLGCTANAPLNAELFGDELAAGSALVEYDLGRPVQGLAYMMGQAGSGRPPLGRARAVVGMLAGGMRAAYDGTIAHCEVAERLAERLDCAPPLRAALDQVFERWDGRGVPQGRRETALALSIRVVQVAETAAHLLRRAGLATAIRTVQARSGTAFDPQVVACFCADAPRLCDDLLVDTVWEATLAAAPATPSTLSEDDIDAACLVLADFADLKSAYTAGRSRAVAALAGAAAAASGLPPAEQHLVRRAGWLHALGRVGVSSGIWDKAGPLTAAEQAQVRAAPGYTESILTRARRRAPIAALAGLHAERLDGSGYPRGLPALLLPPAARLLAAATFYQALREPRAYRPAWAPATAARLLREEVRAGHLDGDAVEAVLQAAETPGPTRRAWPAGLTTREVAVLGLLAQGASMRQVATQLTISEKTVEHHIQHIYSKIGVSRRAAATLFAMQHGLVGAPSDLLTPLA